MQYKLYVLNLIDTFIIYHITKIIKLVFQQFNAHIIQTDSVSQSGYKRKIVFRSGSVCRSSLVHLLPSSGFAFEASPCGHDKIQENLILKSA